MDSKVDVPQVPQCLFQQSEADSDVATLHDENAAEAVAKGTPEMPIVAHGQLEKIRDEFLNGDQISDHQPNRAGGLHEHLTQRKRIALRPFAIGDIAGNLHRAVRIALQPVDARKKTERQGFLVEDIADRLRASGGGHIGFVQRVTKISLNLPASPASWH